MGCKNKSEPNTELRHALEEITSKTEISSHKEKIKVFNKDFGCSLSVLDEYDPSNKEIFHCFEYAFGLYPNLHQSIRLSAQELVSLDGENFWEEFTEYLIENGDIPEKEESALANNDLVLYFINLKAKHAGLWKNGMVKSKWGKGLLYAHKILEVPISYGDPKYFSALPPDLAQMRFREYAKTKNIPDDILAD